MWCEIARHFFINFHLFWVLNTDLLFTVVMLREKDLVMLFVLVRVTLRDTELVLNRSKIGSSSSSANSTHCVGKADMDVCTMPADALTSVPRMSKNLRCKKTHTASFAHKLGRACKSVPYVLKTLHIRNVSPKLAVSADIHVTQRRQLGQRRGHFPTQTIGPQFHVSGKQQKKYILYLSFPVECWMRCRSYVICPAVHVMPAHEWRHGSPTCQFLLFVHLSPAVVLNNASSARI